jgi:hypothetical protein
MTTTASDSPATWEHSDIWKQLADKASKRVSVRACVHRITKPRKAH